MMVVIDEEPYLWLLLRDEAVLYLNVFCSHSAVDYFFLMALNEEECRSFDKVGRPYLNRLAQEIHHSASAVKGSRSRFKARGLTPMLGTKVQDAWSVWLAEQERQAR
ncbi:hypothetical protein JYU29_11210 [Tianweitania sp. BSSL-BM11]|uniref:Uncharacterized protein n=1 Tax=Tianweitania aestuarii TaxID=2814886 RepID=A0ABS5RW55_9HYPH|nr:hypothetical protein [Tianweitania aestuarii]MBS9721256.1 hypothetical protein [Tianweitania aestuarii]